MTLINLVEILCHSGKRFTNDHKKLAEDLSTLNPEDLVGYQFPNTIKDVILDQLDTDAKFQLNMTVGIDYVIKLCYKKIGLVGNPPGKCTLVRSLPE